MHYKTIALAMLQQRRRMHEELRRERKLLSTMETYARELKDSHDAWKQTLQETKPGSDPSQISSQALELAVRELEDRLPPASPVADEVLSLDEAMAPRPTSRG